MNELLALAAICSGMLGGADHPAPMTRASAESRPLCLSVGLDVAARYQAEFPEEGLSRGFQLPRAHLEVGMDVAGVAGARFRMGAVRSGGSTGYIGVAGESLVPRVEILEALFGWRRAGLLIAGGLVEDPWLATGDTAWGFRPILAPMAQEQGWLSRSDLGAAVAWAPIPFVSARVWIHAGEGLDTRERNNGTDITGTLTLRPLAFADASLAEALVVDVMGRDGSRGVGRARDHRFAVRLSTHVGPVRGGVEVMKTWGVAGDAARAPIGLSGWFTVRDPGPTTALGYLRVDAWSEELGSDGMGGLSLHAGGGAGLPPIQSLPLRPLDVVAGYRYTRLGEGILPIAGASARAETHGVFVQLGFRFSGALPLLPALPASATPDPSQETP